LIHGNEEATEEDETENEEKERNKGILEGGKKGT
jgi:hypothetical protein